MWCVVGSGWWVGGWLVVVGSGGGCLVDVWDVCVFVCVCMCTVTVMVIMDS